MEYKNGDLVRSVGGFFIKGIVENVEGNILTIRWIEHSDKGEIDFVQKRSQTIVKPF